MKLQKFIKNKKQKQIIVGSLIGILFIIGGVTFFRTFALYKEQNSFDVLKGTVPNFSNDLQLAILVNGKYSGTIPTNQKDYVVETKCNNKASVEWDYENWGPTITNVTKGTICNLNFLDKNNLETLGKIINKDISTIENLIESIDDLIASKEGMVYLAKSPDIVSDLKSNTNYTEEIQNKLLGSQVIDEDTKYEGGLPFYLAKDGEIKAKIFGDGFIPRIIYAGNNGRTDYRLTGNFNEFFVWYGNTYVVLSTQNKLKVNLYDKLVITTNNVMTGSNGGQTNATVSFGISDTFNNPTFIKQNQYTFSNYSIDEIYGSLQTVNVDLKNSDGEYYLKLYIQRNKTNTEGVSLTKINDVYMV